MARAERYLLDHLGPGDVVVITNYLLSHLGDPDGLRDTRNDILAADGRPAWSGEAKVELYIKALNRFSALAARRGVAVVLVGAGPRHPDIRTCIPDWFNLQHSMTCERTVARELAAAQALNRRLARDLRSNVHVYDPIAALCPKGCNNEDLLKILRDTDHLSVPGARRLGPSFLRFVRGLPTPAAPRRG